ncbi:MAG: hypothetical protein WBC83_03350 [Minisyncoccia bacterium]
MNTAYKTRIASPYQVAKKHPFDISSPKHPVRQEIIKHVGKYDLTAIFKEDTATTSMFRHIPGLIAFVCTIEQSGRVIGIGRSNAVVSENSKYFDRVIQSAWSYSLIDAVSKMTRTVDTLRTNPSKPSYDYEKEAMIDDAYRAKDSQGVEMITDKQKSYLLELIHTNITREDERTKRESQIMEFTKEEASRAIQSFQK